MHESLHKQWHTQYIDMGCGGCEESRNGDEYDGGN